MTRPPCDGLGIVLLFSSVSPGAYAAEIGQALNSYPGSCYLRTDQACSSLTQRTDGGNPIHAVYRPAGYSTDAVCSAVNSYCGAAYGKWLDDATAADATVTAESDRLGSCLIGWPPGPGVGPPVDGSQSAKPCCRRTRIR